MLLTNDGRKIPAQDLKQPLQPSQSTLKHGHHHKKKVLSKPIENVSANIDL